MQFSRRPFKRLALVATFASSRVLAQAAPPDAAPAPANAGPSPSLPQASGAPQPAPPQGPPLRLEDIVKLALTRNERARISELNVVVAEAGVTRARAAFLPTLALSGNDVLRPSQAATTRTSSQSNNTATGTLTLNQPIVNASAWPLYSQARALLDAQRAQTTDDKRLLEFDAARAFFNVLTANAVLTAAQRQYDSANANLADTSARVQAGLTSSNDATRAQIDGAGAARELEVDRGNLQNARIALAFVIDAPVEGDAVPPVNVMQAAEQPIPAYDVLAKVAIEHRPDIQVKTRAADAAHDFADEPLLRLVPTLGISGQIQALANPPATSRWNDESLTAQLTWTLFDAGTRYGDKHLRDANAQIADLGLRTLLRQIASDVRTAVTSLQTEQAAFRLAQQAATSSQQSADETAILYKQGLAKAIELVDANDSRFVAEVNYAVAEYATAQAYVNLRQVIGLEPTGVDLK